MVPSALIYFQVGLGVGGLTTGAVVSAGAGWTEGKAGILVLPI
jgi:hypothetical protein